MTLSASLIGAVGLLGLLSASFLVHLRRLTSLLKPLVDAEYGSATFLTGATRAKLQLRVSTSGLLIRKSPEPIL